MERSAAKTTPSKKAGFARGGAAVKSRDRYKNRRAGLMVHSTGDVLLTTRLSIPAQLSIRMSCLMEIIAGKPAEAKKGLRPSEVYIFDEYTRMKPELRERELKKLEAQYISTTRSK